MPHTGEGRLGVLMVAEAPGKNEDEQGTQLIGKAGQHLRSHLEALSVDLDRDCWKTNSVICFPDGNPTDEQVDACRPNLLRTIGELKPKVIVLMGAAAVRSLLGHYWLEREDTGGIGRWVGWQVPLRDLNAWVCPTWHPSYLLRENNPVLDLWFRRHLRQAFDLGLRPYEGEPEDYTRAVELVYEPDRAASILIGMVDRGGAVAFDYETTRLKPDNRGAAIYTCAVCWQGRKTIAYPMTGTAVQATRVLLASDLEKYGWNIKFEQRWTKAVFGHGVRNLVWDGMVASHVLDNRPGITSLKFQAFVRLGVPPYDSTVGAYLEAPNGNTDNRIHKASLADVLLYNGIDAWATYHLARRQMEEMETDLCRVSQDP